MQRQWIRARRLRNESTDAERRLWYFLRRQQLDGHKFRRQFPLAGYITDFVCVPARLVGWVRIHSMAMLPDPAPRSQRSWPGTGARAARVMARISRLVSWPSVP